MPTIAELLDAADEEVPLTVAQKLAAADGDLDEPATAAAAAPAAQARPWYSRAATGVADPIVGSGQLMQNIIPDSVMNVGRKAVGSIAGALGADQFAQDMARPVSTGQFNQQVAQREVDTKNPEGMDWWRVGGNVANPMSWAGGGAARTLGGAALKGAGAGFLQALMQPVTSDDGFFTNKALQTGIGALAGGVLGPLMFGASKLLGSATAKAKGLVGEDAAVAAQQATDDALQAAGVDPAKVDRNLYSVMRREAAEALKTGTAPNPRVMANRAEAEALPVPIELTRGQAGRDAMQYSWEKNQGSKIQGVGEPLLERLTTQNRQLVENLNELGARNAPSTYDASQQLMTKLQSVDDQLKGQVDAAYSAVRDSAGRPALMDREAFQSASRAALEAGQLTEYVPPAIQKQYNALAQGNIPLTVDVAQQLDRVWSAEQRAAQGSAKMAIGELRKALNAAPVSDSLGEASMEAYKAARKLAAQRFALHDSSPALKAVVDGTEPDKFFQKYVQGANVSELAGIKQLVGPDDSKMLQNTVVGNLKKVALNRASDENGVFSQSAFNKVLQDPVQGPRLQEIFRESPEKLAQLYRLGRVAENIQAFPVGHSVNTSNTAVTAANIIGDVAKSEGASMLWNLLPAGQAVRHITNEATEKAASSKAVTEALNPGVTTAPLQALAPPAKVSKLSDLAGRLGAGYAARESTKDEKKASQD